ncbi:28460_t:CDS:1, partial [Dentiscutata erythropus]
VKWGQKWIPETILPAIVHMRISKKLKILKALQKKRRNSLEK